MAGLKQIKRRLVSVKNTRKITYAMKLVAAAKLRRVQDEVGGLRRYKSVLQDALRRVLVELDGQEVATTLTEEREVHHVRLVVFGGFRGLAGAYNSNVNKEIDRVLASLQRAFPQAKLSATVIGKRPFEHLKRRRIDIQHAYLDLSDKIDEWPLGEIVGELVDTFEKGAIDRVEMIFTEFRSALAQTPTCQCLLPLIPTELATEGEVELGLENICEPDAATVFGELLPQLLRADVQYGALSAQASEHGSRMTAMESATKNADDLASSLRRTYNKLRQSGITSELLDIIGGAEAIS